MESFPSLSVDSSIRTVIGPPITTEKGLGEFFGPLAIFGGLFSLLQIRNDEQPELHWGHLIGLVVRADYFHAKSDV